MGKNVEHIQHIKSNVVLEGKPKLPQPGTLVKGELAVNYAKDVETISLENASGEVVTFSSDKYYTEQKLGSAFTGANSAVTVTDVIEENEEIISSALNDLETRKLDSSAYTPSVELWVSGTGLNSIVLKGSSGTASGDYSVAEGYLTMSIGDIAHAEGQGTSATSFNAHSEGKFTLAAGNTSHAEGENTLANGMRSHAEGGSTSATSYDSHAEGSHTIASGSSSHAEGNTTTAGGDYSHAEGSYTKALGNYSHAEGSDTMASAYRSHAEGDSTSATSDSSHSEGYKTKASGYYAHAEGHYTLASADQSHAEGQQTSATTHSAHAEGVSTLASGTYGAHAEGNNTTASGAASHAEGTMTKANGDYSHAEGNGTTAVGSFSHAEGNGTTANSVFSHVEGWATVANNPGEHASGKYNVSNTAATDSGQTLFSVGNGTYDSRHNAFEIMQNGDIYIVNKEGQDVRLQDELGGGDSLWEAGTGLNSVVLKNSSGTAIGDYSVAEGYSYEYDGETYTSIASGSYSHTEGVATIASGGWGSHAEGYSTSATNQSSHAEGGYTLASGMDSHAEGDSTSATSTSSHAEGWMTLASGYYSHAEGNSTSATNVDSHAEGYNTKASGQYSHAEGNSTLASGYISHAEGDSTSATSQSSHAEGSGTRASGNYSHAEGWGTLASNKSEHASGQYNVSYKASTVFGDSGNTLFSVGNGTADNIRHNAFEIRQNGDIYIVSGNSDIKLQDYIGGGGGSITVDQVLDNSTSASTNPVSSKAVYDAVTDNELVWTNAYVTISGAISSHTEDTSIHLTSTEKGQLHTHSNKSALDAITGNVGTMAYENTSSYSSATQVSTALQGKSNSNHNQAANTITAMTNYNAATAGTSSISTSDNLNTAIGKLENRFDGIRLLKITQTDYDNLQTKDPNTLYVITD